MATTDFGLFNCKVPSESLLNILQNEPQEVNINNVANTDHAPQVNSNSIARARIGNSVARSELGLTFWTYSAPINEQNAKNSAKISKTEDSIDETNKPKINQTEKIADFLGFKSL